MLFPFSELEFIQALHNMRTPALDFFFKFLNFFDRQEFFFILVPALWLGHHWKTGVRLFYILFLSNLANCALKDFFVCPRPFHLDPSIGIIHVSGYGLPSGAAQTAILLAGMVLSVSKSRWRWVVALSYLLFISFSRLYLGVHFLSDIVVGWLIGFLFWLLFIYVRPLIERSITTLRSFSLFALTQGVPLGLLLLQYTDNAIRLCATAMSVGLGLCINNCYQWHLRAPKTVREGMWRASIGVLTIFLGYAATRFLPIENTKLFLFTQFFILGLWLSIGVTLLCRTMGVRREVV
jgi:undecaprenyl-diphosphatase